MSKRVFIVWSGEDNRRLAAKIADRLYVNDFAAIVGGRNNSNSFTVAEDISNQMNSCDLSILLIEKNRCVKNENAPDSDPVYVISGNVMFEWGYLLHKLKHPNKLMACLINMSPGALPSDVQGCWNEALTKNDATEESLDALADDIVRIFLSKYKDIDDENKLYYLDMWEENKYKIFDPSQCADEEEVAKQLLYGMQSTIYSCRYEALYDRLDSLIRSAHDTNLLGVAQCCKAILNVFVSTDRLTKPLDRMQYRQLVRSLGERTIPNVNLREWCKIFLIDKQALCHSYYASSLTDVEEIKKYVLRSVECEKEVVRLLDERLETKKYDVHYAELYYGYAYRELYLNYTELASIEEDPALKAEYETNIKEYCRKSKEVREKLYNHYFKDRAVNSINQDYITQEYLLSLTEWYAFADDDEKEDIEGEAEFLYETCKHEYNIRNMIFDKIEKSYEDMNLNI